MSSLFHHSHFPTTRFSITINHLHDLPASPLPEIAFAGRSNAGKSTAINVLCNQKRLAFASKTPGCTRYINYFSVGPTDASQGHLVDLPGYGYAKVPKSAKAHWQELMKGYLQTRTQLRGLVLLMDSRHLDSKLDEQMIDWFVQTGKPIHILLTKTDKLTRQQSVKALHGVQKRWEAYCAAGMLTVQLFSALTQIGVADARCRIKEWLIGGR